jgi:Ca2+-binding EF-hand superfamily protein
MSGNNNAPLEVPPEFRAFFTSDQMDELVAQFQTSDADGSGSIDEQEFRQLLTRMSLVVSDAEAGDLVASIDTDGNGLIEFPELVAMVIRIKQGDERFSALKKILETLESTPISLLQREAGRL